MVESNPNAGKVEVSKEVKDLLALPEEFAKTYAAFTPTEE